MQGLGRRASELLENLRNRRVCYRVVETPENPRTPRNTRAPGARAAERVLWGLLIIVTISSRFAVAPRVLYDWDAANYALALRHFDVYEHQAHPPGYPIYVLFLKMASWFTSGATTPFLILNAIFTLVTLILLGLLMRRRAGPWLSIGIKALRRPSMSPRLFVA